MRLTAAFAVICLLAACGADGAPKPPAPAPKTGVTISGSASIGVAGKI